MIDSRACWTGQPTVTSRPDLVGRPGRARQAQGQVISTLVIAFSQLKKTITVQRKANNGTSVKSLRTKLPLINDSMALNKGVTLLQTSRNDGLLHQAIIRHSRIR